MRLLLFAILCFTPALGCVEGFDSRPFRVTAERVLAISAEPPEARPSQRVQLSALVVTPEGTASISAAQWAFCSKNRALADNNPVSVECLEDAAFVTPVPDDGGDALRSAATLPADGCRIFGSETPAAQPGQAAIRPVDPDQTGGYYQPVRLRAGAQPAVAFGRVRIQCALAQAPADAVQDFRDRYVPNRTPLLDAFALESGELTVRAGATVRLQASYPTDAAERYVLFDAASRALADRTEALEVSWFATAGVTAEDVSPGASTSASTNWTAPAEAGTVHLWAVIRDERGAASWRSLTLEVLP